MGLKRPKAKAKGKAGKDDKSAKSSKSDKPNHERLTNEELGFVIRTGPDAEKRNKATLEIDAREIVIHAGRSF